MNTIQNAKANNKKRYIKSTPDVGKSPAFGVLLCDLKKR